MIVLSPVPHDIKYDREDKRNHIASSHAENWACPFFRTPFLRVMAST